MSQNNSSSRKSAPPGGGARSTSTARTSGRFNVVAPDGVGVGGIPASHEQFVLKDLDTGMQSYVTDQEWVEKPKVPASSSSASGPGGPSTAATSADIPSSSSSSVPTPASSTTAAAASATAGKSAIASTPSANTKIPSTTTSKPDHTSSLSSSPSATAAPLLTRRPAFTGAAATSTTTTATTGRVSASAPASRHNSHHSTASDYTSRTTTAASSSVKQAKRSSYLDSNSTTTTATGKAATTAAAADPHLANFVHDQFKYQSEQPFILPNTHVRVVPHRKKDRDFSNLYRWQRVLAHDGAVFSMKFNLTGEWLATGGSEGLVKIWDIDSKLEDPSPVHHQDRTTAADDAHHSASATKPSSSAASSSSAAPAATTTTGERDFKSIGEIDPEDMGGPHMHMYIRRGKPYLTCRGHKAEVVDLAWSKNDFLLSAALDGFVRLWHPRAKTCLRRLAHNSLVTCVTFHPTDEQICVTGTIDGTISMWHLKGNKVLSEIEAEDLVTSIAITPDGTTAMVGTQHGRCKLYALFDEIQGEWQLKYTTQIEVRSKRAKLGRKVCGFQFYGHTGDKVLITSNDSRLRIYRLDDKSVMLKFVGTTNAMSRFKGSFDPTGRYVLCGSEDHRVIIWDLHEGKPSSSGGGAFGGGGNYSVVDTGSTYNPVEEFAQQSGGITDLETASVADTAASSNRSIDDNTFADDISMSMGHQLYLSPPSQQQLEQNKGVRVAHESFVVDEDGCMMLAAFAPKRVPRDAMFSRGAYSNQNNSGLVMVTCCGEGGVQVFGCC